MTDPTSVYDLYFADVGRTPVTASAFDERMLFYRYHELGDQAARTELIRSNLRFVIKVARQFYRGNADQLMTLVTAGNVGLITAVDKYCQWVIECHHCQIKNYVKRATHQRCKNCGRRLRKSCATRFTTRFLTYANWWIQEAIRAELYASSQVKIPPYKQKEHSRRRRNGETVGITYTPYDENETEGDAALPGEMLRRLVESFSEEPLQQRDAARILHHALKQLSPRETYVLVAYFGLRDDAKNLREIAGALSISPERVRQVKEDGLGKLRGILADYDVTAVGDI